MANVIELCTMPEKEQQWDLLYLADPDKDMVMKYLVDGRMFAVFEGDDCVSEAVTFVRQSDHQLELKNLATREDAQHKGYATMLIEHIRAVNKGKYDWLYVGTAFFGLYEHWGFVYAYTVENFFVDNYPEPIIDEGRQCIDMVYFRLQL